MGLRPSSAPFRATDLEHEQTIRFAEPATLLRFPLESLLDDPDRRVVLTTVTGELGAVEDPEGSLGEAGVNAVQDGGDGSEVAHLGGLPAGH